MSLYSPRNFQVMHRRPVTQLSPQINFGKTSKLFRPKRVGTAVKNNFEETYRATSWALVVRPLQESPRHFIQWRSSSFFRLAGCRPAKEAPGISSLQSTTGIVELEDISKLSWREAYQASFPSTPAQAFPSGRHLWVTCMLHTIFIMVLRSLG